MNTTSRVDFLFYVSIFLLFSHNYFVKSIPFNLLNRNNLKHINNIREGEINNFKSPMANTEKRLFVWSDVLSFPSKRDMQQRTIERKGQMEDNSIGTVIAQFLRDFSRTFHMIGDVIGTIFKQKKAEDINNLQSYPYDINTVYHSQENLKPELVSDAYIGQDYLENDVQGSFEAPDIVYGGFVPCNPPRCVKVHRTTIAPKTATKATVQQESYDHIDYTGGTIYGTLTEYNHGSRYVISNHSNSLDNLQSSKEATGNSNAKMNKHGHQLVDLIKTDYNYVPNQKGVMANRPASNVTKENTVEINHHGSANAEDSTDYAMTPTFTSQSPPQPPKEIIESSNTEPDEYDYYDYDIYDLTRYDDN